MRARVYLDYRTPPPPVRVVVACAAFALVVGLLFVGYATAAGVVAGAYLAFGGRAGGRAPGVGTFVWAAGLLALCAVERVVREAYVGAGIFVAVAVLVLVVAPVLGRVPGRGGAIG